MPTMVALACPQCDALFQRAAGTVRYRRKKDPDAVFFCSRDCGAVFFRKPPVSPEEKRRLKAEYDRQRRTKLGDDLRASKRRAYYRDHSANLQRQRKRREDPATKARERACQDRIQGTEEYRAHKREYDRWYRARKTYGDEWAECAILLIELRKEIRSRATWYERHREQQIEATKRGKIRRGESSMTDQIDAKTLRATLWKTLNDVRDGNMTPAQADAVADLAKGVLGTVKTQLQVVRQAGADVPKDAVQFATGSEDVVTLEQCRRRALDVAELCPEDGWTAREWCEEAGVDSLRDPSDVLSSMLRKGVVKVVGHRGAGPGRRARVFVPASRPA